MTVDIKTSAAVSLNFDKVQELRDLKDTVLSLSAYCKAGSEIIEALQEVAGADLQGTWALKPFDTRLRGHAENLCVLTKRISNTIELVSAAYWDHCVLGLIDNAFGQVCLRTGSEESVLSRRYQQSCLSTCREDNQRHDGCNVDHTPDSVLSAR